MLLSEQDTSRFWSKVDIGGPDECWNWNAGKISGGYGEMTIDGANRYAHRLAWGLANGQDIPHGMVIRHTCDNKLCCNPAHLLLGTPADNIRDMYGRGREARGEKHGNSKLTEEQVLKIREALSRGEMQYVIAERFGVARQTIGKISAGYTWARLDSEEGE